MLIQGKVCTSSPPQTLIKGTNINLPLYFSLQTILPSPQTYGIVEYKSKNEETNSNSQYCKSTNKSSIPYSNISFHHYNKLWVNQYIFILAIENKDRERAING